ncbi:MAG: hypothetical protein HY077_04495 [Elusimicrobia bacterium]|nr:hypothetical protein [Elusimicrobiota bacterium]
MKARWLKATFAAAVLAGTAGEARAVSCMGNVNYIADVTNSVQQVIISNAPATFTGDLCIHLHSPYTGADDVDSNVGGVNRNMNGFRIIISSDVGFPAVVNVITGVGFDVHSPSVTIAGLTISAVATGATYAVVASSAYVQISSTVVNENGNIWANAAVSISSLSTIDDSSFTASGFPALLVLGSSNTIYQSTMTNNSAGNPVVALYNSSTNTFYNTYIGGAASFALLLSTGSNGNSVANSTITSSGVGVPTLYLVSAASNTFSQDDVVSLNGNTAYFLRAASNTIVSSTFTSNTTIVPTPCGYALALDVGASSNTIANSIFNQTANGGALQILVGADANKISGSYIINNTITCNDLFIGGSSNTVTQSFADNPSAGGVMVTGSSNLLSLSTMTANFVSGGNGYAFTLAGASNTAVAIYAYNGATRAMQLAGSNNNVFGSTAASSNGASDAAMVFCSGSSNTFTGGRMSNPLGKGLDIRTTAPICGPPADHYTVQASTIIGITGMGVFASSNTFKNDIITGTGNIAANFNGVGVDSNTLIGCYITGNNGGVPAMALTAASSTTVIGSFISNTNASGEALQLSGGGSTNLISASTMTGTAGGCTAGTLHLSGVSYNAIVNSYVANPSGNGVFVSGGSNSNTIDLSTMTSAAGGCGGDGVYIGGGALANSFNTISNSYLYGNAGAGAMYYDFNASFNTVTLSTMITTVSGVTAMQFVNTGSNNTISQSYISALAPAAAAVSFGCGGTLNSVVKSTMVSVGGATTTVSVIDSFTTLSSDTITNTGGGPGVIIRTAGACVGDSSTLSYSTVTSLGIGVKLDGTGSPTISNSYIQGSTGVLVMQSTGSVLTGDFLFSTGFGGSAFWSFGAAAQSVGATTMTVSGALANAMSLAGPGPGAVTAAGPLFLRGDVRLTGTALNGGAFSHLVGGDFIVPNIANWNPQTSTVTFDGSGDVPARTSVAIDGTPVGSGVNFNGLAVNINRLFFSSNTSGVITTFTDDFAGSTVTFKNGPTYTIDDLEIHGGALVTGFANLRSSLSGTPWSLNLVAASSVTRVSVSDSNAGAGKRVDANDLMSVDGGGNTNWNFLPFLAITSFQQTYNSGTGNSPVVPPVQFAGNPFTVTVYAVSSSSHVVAAAFPVALNSNEPYGSVSPSVAETQTLVAGATDFVVTFRTAEPFGHLSGLNASPTLGGTVYGAASLNVPINPNASTRLQVLMPGETADPGGPTGTVANLRPDVQVQGVAIPAVTVRQTDSFFNLLSTTTSRPVLILGTNVSSASWPSAPQATAGGFTTFASTITVYSTSSFVTITSSDNAGGIANGVSTPFIVALPSLSPPTVSLNLASATVASIGGALSGAASDGSAVNKVLVGIQDTFTGSYYSSWPLPGGTFSNPSIVLGTTTLSAQGQPTTNWSIALPDAKLTSGRTYLVTMTASNASGFNTTVVSSFTFNPGLLVFGGTGGQGSAGLAPAISTGCQAAVETLVFTVGASGIAPGGGVAVRLPDGWGIPTATTTVVPAPILGLVGLTHTNPAVNVAVGLNPPAFSSVTLGAGWTLMAVTPGPSFASGDTIAFSFNSFPPLDPSGRGAQFFSVLSAGDSSSPLLPISPQPPPVNLLPGTTGFLAFTSYSPFSIGPLQPSATMQLQLTDLCGNSKSSATVIISSLSAIVPTPSGPATDATAVFYNGAGPVTTVSIQPGLIFSDTFYFTTSTTGVNSLFVHATASLPAAGYAGFVAEANRAVTILGSSLTFTSVSIDTGTPSPGNKTSTLTPAVTSFVTIRFAVNASDVPWDVVISTDPVNFSPQVFYQAGLTDVSHPQNVAWNGVNELVFPAQFVSPNTYYARIRAAQGVIQDTSLRINIPQSAFIYGTLGAFGPGAILTAVGPGAGLGNAALASATGYFQIFGLVNGNSYDIAASSSVILFGQSVVLSTTVFGVTAANAGTLLPATSFAVPGLVRVNVTLPKAPFIPAPRDIGGRAFVHNAAYTKTSAGTLHFFPGSVSSDNGAQDFGQTASSLTALVLPPDIYTLEISVPDMNLSTAVAGVAVTAGGLVDEFLALPRKANVAGYAILPSTTPFGSAVSVQAQLLGSLQPTVFSGTFVPPDSPLHLTSAPYALYGLDPGSWTITAKSGGFSSTATTVLITTADVGNLMTGLGGLDLTLSSGGIIVATVTVLGDTTKVFQCFGNCVAGYFDLPLQAYNPQTFANSNVQVRLAQNAAITQSTVAISGLDSGTYVLRAFLSGFNLAGGGGQQVSVSSPSVAVASVTLVANNARLMAEIDIPRLPGGVCHSSTDFKSVGLLIEPPDAFYAARADITGITPTLIAPVPPTYENLADGTIETFYCSSMTLLSPPGGTGFGTLGAMYGPTGGFALQTVPLANNATAPLLLDVSMATFTVKGRVSLSGSLGLAGTGGVGSFAVGVSSVAGVLLNTPATGYCLLSSSNPVTVSAFHLELVPVDPHDRGLPGPFIMKGPGALGACSVLGLSAGGGPPIFSPIGFIAAINPDGTYQFSGVPAGDYVLRNNPDLDLDPGDGLELAPLHEFLRVTSDTAGVDLPMGSGSKLAGSVLLPPGVAASFPVAIVLEDSHGQPLRALNLGFNAANAITFLFDLVPDGKYAIAVVDLRSPRVFVAPPREVSVDGASVSGLTLRMAFSGTIKAGMAVRQALAGGTTQFVLITRQNESLLPPGFGVAAVADPWFIGGFAEARGSDCSAGGCRGIALDSDDKVVIEGLLPGTYDVEFVSRPGAQAADNSGLSLVTTVRSSVRVVGGQTTDIGVVQLVGGVSLSGVVTDVVTSSPIANVRMQARPAVRLPGESSGRSGLPEAFTDQQGRYVFSGLDPTARFYDVFAGVRLGEHQGDVNPAYEQKIAASVDIQSTTTLSFALTPAPYSISGQVLTRNNETLRSGEGVGEGTTSGAAIYLQKSGVVPTANPVADIVFLTDAYGKFTIPNLTRGTYRMSITALGYLTNNKVVNITTGSVSLGQLQLDWGSTIQGAIRKTDGSNPSEDEVALIIGATPDLSDFFFGLGTRDPFTRSITGYSLSGFKLATHYRLLLVSSDGQQLVSPPEASDIVFVSSQEIRNLDIVYKPSKPFVVAKDRRSGTDFLLTFQFSQALRDKTAADEDLTVLLTTAGAQGKLSAVSLAVNRRTLSAVYSPAVNESSFTLHLRAYTTIPDPDSIDTINPEFVVDSTAAFFVGIDGAHKANINNLAGGALVVEGDAARVTLPKGAFGIDVSSAVTVLMQKFNANVNTGGQQGTLGVAAANVKSLPFPASAYPSHMVQAVAALPPAVNPFSGFYDILLPLGLRTALSRPVPMTITYSTGTDPTTLNLYWYNAAANAYILQQDVTGSPPIIDTINHTITINVNHFSTFVLFNTGVEVITGNAFPGTDIEAYNFPNPFDLNDKVVHAIHGGACHPNCTVRGTLIRFSLPPDVSGDASLRIYNTAGDRVRTISLGTLAGGNFFYQPWDGRNDAGRDVASGVYIGQVKVGQRSKFFKMALIK